MAEITIKGKAYPIHFGLRTLNRFAIMRNEEFSDILTAKNALASFDAIVELAVMGLNDGAERAGSDHRFTENDVWDIFEEEPELILIVSEMFVESITPLAERLGKLPKKLETPNDQEETKVTYELWYSIAVGQMGMRPQEFEQMTAAEFYYAWVGWSSRQVELQQQAWERTRWEAWVLTSIQLDKKDRKPMHEMYPLPWDKTDITPPDLSIEERRERVNEMLKCIEK